MYSFEASSNSNSLVFNPMIPEADWSFDNLDEIVAIAIKAEFNAFDLADLTDESLIKEEPNLGPSQPSQPQMTGQNSAVLECSSQNHSSQQSNRDQLNDREKARLDELFLASRALVEPVEHEREVSQGL